MQKKTKKSVSCKDKKKKRLFSLMTLWALFLAAFVLFLDQGSKYLVQEHIPLMTHESQWYPYNGIGLLDSYHGIEISVVHTTNRGSAWGLFSQYQGPLVALRIFFSLAIVLYLFFFNKSKELVIPLSLVAAGAIGNIIDYFTYGKVIDMFHFVFFGYHYPVFNIADAAIFVGVFSIFILSLMHKKKNLYSKT